MARKVSEGIVGYNAIVSIGKSIVDFAKNKTGSTNNSSKLYLVGAASQSSAIQTYSHSGTYVDSSDNLCSTNMAISCTSSDTLGQALTGLGWWNDVQL